MDGSAASGVFFVNLAIIGGIVTVAVYQVPQPWRGILVALVLFMLTVGTFALRIIRHHYEYKSMLLSAKQPPTPAPHRRKRRVTKGQGLNVINASSVGGGRRVI
jgi:hypothetical protein